MVKKMGEISLLYDFYGELLTDRQRTVLEYYYGDDYTLGEIAEAAGISRQAVHDTVRKAERALRSYESALGLVARYSKNQENIRTIEEIFSDIERKTDDPGIRKKLDDAMDLINKLE